MTEFESEGFGFAPYRDSPEYGVSISSGAWIMQALVTFGEFAIKGFSEAGWAEHQDVVVCQRI